MHAALVTGRHTVDFVEFPDPVASAGKVVVDIEYCGICGTDLHAWQSGDPYNPAICGHEWTGVVSAVGRSVPTVAEGDRVVVGVPAAGVLVSVVITGAATRGVVQAASARIGTKGRDLGFMMAGRDRIYWTRFRSAAR